MKIVVGLFVLLLATSAFADCGDVEMDSLDSNTKNSPVGIKILGSSPRFRVYPTSDPTQSYTVAFSTFTETGVNRQTQSLGDMCLNWTTSTTTINGQTTTVISMTAFKIRIGDKGSNITLAKMTIDAYMVQSATTVQNGNETVSVPNNSLKFTLNLEGWPFVSYSNNLDWKVTVTADAASGHGNDVKDESTATNKQVSVNYGGLSGLVQFANTVVVDGTNHAVVVNTQQNGNVMDVTITFPSFKTSLSYDPVLSLQNGGVINMVSLPILLLALVASFMSRLI